MAPSAYLHGRKGAILRSLPWRQPRRGLTHGHLRVGGLAIGEVDVLGHVGGLRSHVGGMLSRLAWRDPCLEDWGGGPWRPCIPGQGLDHAQDDLGLEQGLGELGVVHQGLAGLAEVLLDQVLHLGQDAEQVCVGHVGQHGGCGVLGAGRGGADCCRHGLRGVMSCRMAHHLRPTSPEVKRFFRHTKCLQGSCASSSLACPTWALL